MAWNDADPQGREASGETTHPQIVPENASNLPGRGDPSGDEVAAIESAEPEFASHCRITAISEAERPGLENGAQRGAVLPMEFVPIPQGRNAAPDEREKSRLTNPFNFAPYQVGGEGPHGFTYPADEVDRSRQSASHCRNTVVSDETSSGHAKQTAAESSKSMQVYSVSEETSASSWTSF